MNLLEVIEKRRYEILVLWKCINQHAPSYLVPMQCAYLSVLTVVLVDVENRMLRKKGNCAVGGVPNSDGNVCWFDMQTKRYGTTIFPSKWGEVACSSLSNFNRKRKKRERKEATGIRYVEIHVDTCTNFLRSVLIFKESITISYSISFFFPPFFS